MVGYERLYSVSSLGHVRRDTATKHGPAGRLLKPQFGPGHKYLFVRLVKVMPDIKTLRVHHLVAAAFIGPRPLGLFLNHKDANRHNNAADNLEYVTKRQNEDHAVALALHPWGERHAMAKLTEDAVREIRASSLSNPELAAKYSVHKGTIVSVKSRRTWRRVA